MSQYSSHDDMEYDEIQDLLLEAQEQHQNFTWLDEHASKLLHAMKIAAQRQAFQSLAANTLLLIYQWVTVRKHCAQCIDIFYGAVLNYGYKQPDYYLKKVRLFLYYGQNEALLGNDSSAVKKFERALTYANTDALLEEYVRIYTRFFRNSLQKLGHAISPELVADALKLADKLGKDHFRAQIYLSLSQVYLALYEFDNARVYGCKAYDLWRQRSDVQAMADSLYMMALIYRRKNQGRRAAHYLQRAKHFYARAENWDRFAQMDYEQAAMYFEDEKFAEALSWIHYAQRELQSTPAFDDLPYHQAATKQLMGMIYIELNEFQEAQPYIEGALKTWQAVGNIFEEANSLNSLAYMEGRQGNTTDALQTLDAAEMACVQLSDSGAKAYMQDLIQRTRDELFLMV